MSVKFFSAEHQRDAEGVSVRFFSHETENAKLWLSALIPAELDAVFERLFSLLREELFSLENGDEAFEKGLKSANELLTQELSPDIAEKILRDGGILLGFLKDDELLVSSFGIAEILLLRERKLIDISEGLSPHAVGGDFFQNISSGDMQSGDRILLSTFRLQRFLTERQIATALSDGVTEAMEEISFALREEPGHLFLLHAKAPATLPFVEDDAYQLSQKKQNWKGVSPDSIFDFFRQQWKWLLRKLPKNPAYGLLAGAGILGVFLIFLFFSLLSGKVDDTKGQEYEEFLTGVEREFLTAQTRVTEGNRDLANQVLNNIEKNAIAMRNDRVNVSQAQAILDQVSKERESINQITRITNPTVMSDLTKISPDFSARGMYELGSEIFVFDKDALVRVLSASVDPERVGIITSGDEIVVGTGFSGKDEAIFVTKSGSILEEKEGVVTSADTADEAWQSPVAMATYSKFLYFLDPRKNQIWKYERRNAGFTKAEIWIGGNADLTTAKSIAIDGAVFVLDDNGIQKFYAGEKEAYEVKGISPDEIRGDIIFTNQNLAKIFILNKAERKIIILDKGQTEANYDRQIVLENTDNLVGLFADETQVFVLGEQKVYNIKL